VPFLEQVKGTICCFGADAKKINAATARAEIVADLQAAIENIVLKVNAGDLVILSPACASFDMYPNFMARGNHFKALVKQLVVGEG